MENEELGFGAVEACQDAIGISCEECRYNGVCRGGNDGTLQEMSDEEYANARLFYQSDDEQEA